MGTVAAFAQEAAPAAAAAAPAAPALTVDKGDTAWMMISTVLVLLMTIPGLALFYGGLVRTKNMLSRADAGLHHHLRGHDHLGSVYGYSLAFTAGGRRLRRRPLQDVFLAGVDVTTLSETFTKGVAIPELVFVVFQMTFACITPALIVGAFAERIKFSALILFVMPLGHVRLLPDRAHVWFWGGPSAMRPVGLIFGFGALDFAGGTVVHINAGIAGLVGALMIGKRDRLRQGHHGAALDDADHGRRFAAVGRLVRLQRRFEPRSRTPMRCWP